MNEAKKTRCYTEIPKEVTAPSIRAVRFSKHFFLEITNLKKIIIHCLFLKCQGNFAKYHLVSFRKVPYNVCNGQESNPICLVLGCPNKLCTPVVSSGVRSVLSIVFEVRSEGPFFIFPVATQNKMAANALSF